MRCLQAPASILSRSDSATSTVLPEGGSFVLPRQPSVRSHPILDRSSSTLVNYKLHLASASQVCMHMPTSFCLLSAASGPPLNFVQL